MRFFQVRYPAGISHGCLAPSPAKKWGDCWPWNDVMHFSLIWCEEEKKNHHQDETSDFLVKFVRPSLMRKRFFRHQLNIKMLEYLTLTLRNTRTKRQTRTHIHSHLWERKREISHSHTHYHTLKIHTRTLPKTHEYIHTQTDSPTQTHNINAYSYLPNRTPFHTHIGPFTQTQESVTHSLPLSLSLYLS